MSAPAKIKIAVKMKTLANVESVNGSDSSDDTNSSDPVSNNVSILDMSTVKDRFTSDTYFRTSNSLINKINTHFGWPKGIIPIKNYEQQFTDIIKFVIDTYSVYTKEALSAKYSAIICPLKIIEYDGPLMDMRELLEAAHIPARSNGSKTWSDMTDILDQNFLKSKHPGGKIVAMAYKYGYFLSLSDMVHTRIDPGGEDDLDHNYLNLETGCWCIRGDIHRHKQSQTLSVSDEFIHSVKGLLRKGSKWLVSKKGGQPYRSPVALKHLDLSGFTINQLRNAYANENAA